MAHSLVIRCDEHNVKLGWKKKEKNRPVLTRPVTSNLGILACAITLTHPNVSNSSFLFYVLFQTYK